MHLETLSRRDWLRKVGLGGTAGFMAGVPLPGSASIAATHRLQLEQGPLSVTLVDNHDGLAGQQQIDRRARMPLSADGHDALFCTVPYEERFNGYNGVARLHNGDSASPFLPCASGHNCEFFFDQTGSSYEPRWTDQPKFLAQSSSLTPAGQDSARLSIEPGSQWGVQVNSRFQIVEPFYLDIEHSFEPTESASRRRVLGVFWASYIQTPREPAFYFRTANEEWMNVYGALAHGRSGVIAPAIGPVGSKLAARDRGRSLLYGLSSVSYGRPFYCGNINGMLLSLMFQPTDEIEIRLAFNPSGGGPAVPAWDYQALVAEPKPGRRYSFKTRTVYKPFEGLDEALELHRSWSP